MTAAGGRLACEAMALSSRNVVPTEALLVVSSVALPAGLLAAGPTTLRWSACEVVPRTAAPSSAMPTIPTTSAEAVSQVVKRC